MEVVVVVTIASTIIVPSLPVTVKSTPSGVSALGVLVSR